MEIVFLDVGFGDVVFIGSSDSKFFVYYRILYYYLEVNLIDIIIIGWFLIIVF